MVRIILQWAGQQLDRDQRSQKSLAFLPTAAPWMSLGECSPMTSRHLFSCQLAEMVFGCLGIPAAYY